MGTLRCRVRHREGCILADLLFYCLVPLLHVRGWTARHAHGKNGLAIEEAGCGVAPNRLVNAIRKRIIYRGLNVV